MSGRQTMRPGARVGASVQRLPAAALHCSRGNDVFDLGREDVCALGEADESGSRHVRVEPAFNGAEAGLSSQPVLHGLIVAGVLGEEGVRLKRRLDGPRRFQADGDADGFSEAAVPHLKLLVNEERNGRQTHEDAKSSIYRRVAA